MVMTWPCVYMCVCIETLAGSVPGLWAGGFVLALRELLEFLELLKNGPVCSGGHGGRWGRKPM